MGCAILHAFNWTFAEITDRLDEIQTAGYTAILTSPISYSHGEEWWMRYQPLDYRLIHSPLGDKQAFVTLLEQAKLHDIGIYVDIVINHMAHRAEGESLFFPGEAELENYRTDPALTASHLYGDLTKNQFAPGDFNPKRMIENYNSIEEIRNYRIQDERVPNGLPDFKLVSKVAWEQKQYLLALLELGVIGFRIDAAKHVPTAHLNAIIDEEILAQAHVFAEVIPNQRYQIMSEVINETEIALYDFPLFYRIRKSFDWGESFKQLEALENYPPISKFRAITFVNTHDIPNNRAMNGHLFHSMTDEMLAYAYILGRDGGCPLIFTDKGDNQNAVESFGNRWHNLYKDPALQKMLQFHNAAHGQPMRFSLVNDGLLVCERRDTGFFAINKTSDPLEAAVSFDSLDGPFVDRFTQQRVTIQNRTCALTVPPRAVLMFLSE